ncbi:CRISPR-associated endonuclease Cas1 [Pelotomaculum schinkii]|uniref:CRISPR-associated endonuclease Cas1 n=1 Tax=Pelotomaculum schinkii TaxID=78350 RepID=A0A4Y7RAZ5_9FIRM|nr:type I-B CRISPR-associated endonuclease Cas1b [Pelotomaculum schinkii]TEB05976.1 CRISPR-associated endonuclease Cas1 [Pelotomaculum schinkii]
MKQAYYIFSNGILKRNDNTLQLVYEDGQKKDIPIERVDELYILGETSVNTKLLDFLAKNNICIHFYNYYEYYVGSFTPRESLVSGKVLICQVQHNQDHGKRMALAKAVIQAASYNIYRNIRYYNKRGKDLESHMARIENLRDSINYCENIEELMGVEGNIRKIYYDTWETIINQQIDFRKRVKHPPDNMINSLISFINSLVYTKVLSEIYKTQLNPTVSFLHEPSTKRFSLSLDIAEVFKPLIADRLIFTLLNKNMINEKSFDVDQYYLRLKPQALKLITNELDQKLKTTIKHRDLGRDVSYQYLIRLELYKLIKHIIGEKPYQGFKIWW